MKKNQKPYRILVVEDNASLRNGIVATLQKEGYSVDNAEDGLKGLKKTQINSYNLLITDIKMPGMDGIQLFKKVKARFPKTDVIIITAYATVEIAVNAIKSGAEDFITKPFPLAELRTKVNLLYRRWESAQISESDGCHRIIGQSQAIRKIRGLIKKVAVTDSPVLITGQSGTGKELVARSIHESSGRANGPFVAVNCGALAETLLESELFGHEKGAFTGAVRAHAGKFEQATGGTLLLDEIGDMPQSLQVKLLRVLQNKEFQRVGGEKSIQSDFRLIAATNKDLDKMVNEELFRSDLYYRINVIPIHIPPLSERPEDIPLLIDYILAKRAEKLQRSIPKIQASVMRKLQNYSWPGNVRELENFIERALVFIEDNIFTEELFSFDEKKAADIDTIPIPARDMDEYISKIEREMIVNALKDNHGVKQRAADQLNIKPGTLYYKIEKYGIEDHEYAP